MKRKDNELLIEPDELLTLKEVAERSRIGMRLLREAIGRREIRIVKYTGKIWRIRESDRLRWIESKTRKEVSR